MWVATSSAPAGSATDASTEPPAARGTSRSEPRWANALVIVLLMAFSFLQRLGETTFDTKLDLSVDPGNFLLRTLQAWNPESAMGEMQNQAYGYLFPHGLFFWIGDVVGLPEWVVQRLWSGVLLVVAYEGARRLFRAIDHDLARPFLPLLAGLAFALSPRLLGLSGALTGEIHPSAMLPWVVLPLVLVLRGRLGALHGAAWSGVAILLMGGVNASEVLLALVLPGLCVLAGLRTPAGRKLLLWWPLAVVAATAWWVAGLLIQGKYAPPFLDYIETSAVTTQPLGWTNVVRGADHWLSFVWTGGQPWWTGSYQLANDPLLIALAGLVTAVSLGGLFHPRMPWRLPLAGGFLVAAVLLTLGHVDALGSPLSGTFQQMLDGVLSPFRNIHKLDPVLRLPMALGFAHGVGILSTWIAGVAVQRWPDQGPRRVRSGTACAGVLLLALSAQPLFTGDLRKPGWKEIPDAWHQAADYLAERRGEGRTMVLPGAGFGQQTWGWTIDEPFQAVADSPWVSRSQVPLTPGSTIRYLDAIEERIQDGVGSPVLADALARAGVKYLLVRRDLDLWATEAPTPARVDQALALSPGLEKVADFGELGSLGGSMIDVYEVDRNVPLVEAVDVSSVKTLAGGPEDTLTAMEAGLLSPGEVTVNASEPGWEETPDVVGDGFRRRERQFGRLVDAVSEVMAKDEDYRTRRKVHDYHGVAESDRVHARYTSLKAVRASSSSGYVDTFGSIRSEQGPFAAIDGSEESYWRSAPFADPTEQWIEFEFGRAETLTGMRVVAGVDSVSGTPVRRVRIEVGDRSYDRNVDPGSGEVVLELPGTKADRVRIKILSVFGDPDMATVAVREVSFDGLPVARTLVLPDKGADEMTATVFRARSGRRACVDLGFGPQCDPFDTRSSEEENGLDRAFTTSGEGTFEIRGTVVARSTAAAARLLDPLPNQVTAVASSVTGEDPQVSGQRAMDGNRSSAWIAARGDAEPRLELSWGEERTISRISVESSPLLGSAPSKAVIEAQGERREVALGNGALGYFDPITASSVRITFPMQTARPGGEQLAPLSISELHLKGTGKAVANWDAEEESGAQCGFGPQVELDGTTFETRVVGTKGDVARGIPMDLLVCGERELATLAAGEHSLVARSTDQFAVTSLTIQPQGGSALAQGTKNREVAIQAWGATRRTVQVGAGDEGVLRVPENVNAGWRATLDGVELETLRLDGWQQGFRLPAGGGGEVVLEFIPDRTYRLQLFLGALLALGLVAVAVALQRRRAAAPAGPPSRTPRWLATSSASTWSLGALAAWLLGGVPVLLGLLVGAFRRHRGGGVGWVAVLLVLAAVLSQALSAWRGDGIEVGWADWLAGVAVGLWAATLVRTRRDEEE